MRQKTKKQLKEKKVCANCGATESKMERFGYPWWERWLDGQGGDFLYCSLECYHTHAKAWEKERTCQVCGYTGKHSKRKEWDWLWWSGRDVCSDECYDTFFEPCLNCGKVNSSAQQNRLHGIGSLPKEQLCDACYCAKHNLTVVTLKF